ncbi:MAG: hypothetical protein ABSD67_08520 [Terracidiphilus sp.]|jgi:hypothetical protein
MATTSKPNSELHNNIVSTVPGDESDTSSNKTEKKVDQIADKAAHKAAKKEQDFDEVNNKPFTN